MKIPGPKPQFGLSDPLRPWVPRGAAEHGAGSARQSRTPTIARWNASVTELCWGLYRDNIGIRGYIEVMRVVSGLSWDSMGLCMVLSRNPILMANVTAFKGRTF